MCGRWTNCSVFTCRPSSSGDDDRVFPRYRDTTHNYTQAGILHPYTIRMSTILRDSGTHIFARAHDNVRHVDKILEELTERDVLLSSTKEVLRGSRNSLVDVKYTLLPTMQFIQEVKKANVRTAKLTEQLQRAVGKELAAIIHPLL